MSRVNSQTPNISVAQLGARMHYAVPRILQNREMLANLYTDACAKKGLPRLLCTLYPETWGPDLLRRLLDRVPEGIPPSKITAYTWLGMGEMLLKYKRNSLSDKTARYLSTARKFGEKVANSSSFWDADAVYAFKTAALEIMKKGRERGVTTILEHPNVHRRTMHDLLRKEHQLYPGWADPREKDRYLDEECKRQKKEWRQADLIICPSSFVQRSIECAGGPVERTTVVPYGVDFQVRSEPRTSPARPLHVLSVGTVSLRKGAPYLLRVARRSPAKFRMVGSINLHSEGRKKLTEEVDLVGKVPRSKIHNHYEWADVFVLPSICEGSATVVYEALAYALPVICTPNTGAIVEDGKDGFVVPIREADPIADRLERLASDSDLYRSMSRSALQRFRDEGSLGAYGERLISNIVCLFSD